MDGRHPVTGEPLRRAGADTSRVVALDLTYSAPKSVSVVWAFADPELRAAIEGALERSADRAMRRRSRGRRWSASASTARCSTCRRAS